VIAILHGYLLDGSGSNLWTRSIVQALCRQGETVHLVCQEPHPETFDFIATCYRYRIGGAVETIFNREVPYGGRCIMHKPEIGDTLPVYVWDRYEEFPNVVPMVDLPDEAIDYYLDRNTEALTRIIEAHGITAMHVNHSVLMSVAVERASLATRVPFAIMPHGSCIEYAVKKDERFLRLAEGAFTAASRVFVIGREMRERVNRVFASVPGIDSKITGLNLGVDTSLFEPVGRERREENIEGLLDGLASLPRGKTREMSQALLERLRGDMSLEEVSAAMEQASHYNAKLPDADLEARLREVDWAGEKIMLFVGRLISSKGPQSIIAALPLIFDEHPDARLIAVGHGPLREGLEAFVWALQNGERALAEKIIEWGGALEGGERKPFGEARLFLDRLAARGELDNYFEKARQLNPDRIIFTGYLTHRELRHLFPCSEIAIFPSVVAEAGPLVFLEALASGCFPLGTYFAGMAASIDSVSESLPDNDGELMKLSADPKQTVADIAGKAAAALSLAGKHKETLREVAVRRYDWESVARKLISELRSLPKATMS
jgi:glycosyltransferase involved in cell wall biosynthesis